MSLIDTQSATLNLRVKRSERGLPVHHTLFDLATYRDKLMHVLHFHDLSSVRFQGPFGIPLLILLWPLCISLLLHESPVSLRGPFTLPLYLYPLPEWGPQWHHFPSRQ